MSNFSKSRWHSEGDEIRIGIDFSKVDKSGRMVSGWATVDNVDTEGDIVTSEASIDAFARSRGNLREMHKKDSAVGRIVSHKVEEFTAPDGKVYNGIFVKVRVSKGAQDTWEKVLDGTLNGFSIGGEIKEAEEEFNKSTGEKIRKVNKYDLNELSLVDNPGNQYSDFKNIFKMKKSADGSVTTLTGMIEEEKILNVFYCNEDEISKQSPLESYDCPICDKSMSTIGFIEDGSNNGEKVSALVTKYVKSEGGVTMEKNKKEDETVETGHEEGDPTEVPTPTTPEHEVNSESVEEVEGTEETNSENVEEVHDESEEISKRIDSLKEDITKILGESHANTSEKIDALEKVVGENRKVLEEKLTEWEKKYSALHTDLATTKSRIPELEARIEKINSRGALKKSADVEDDPAERVQKSDTNWNGAFSVDNLFN